MQEIGQIVRERRMTNVHVPYLYRLTSPGWDRIRSECKKSENGKAPGTVEQLPEIIN